MAHPKDSLVQHLSDDGTSTGSVNMAVDGSVTPVDFWFQIAAPHRSVCLNRLIFLIRDNNALAAEKFGGLSELTNGLTLGFFDTSGNLLSDCFGGVPQKSNADLGGIFYDTEPSHYGSGDDFLHGRFSFDKWLNGGACFADDTILKATISDDLSGLVAFRIALFGTYLT